MTGRCWRGQRAYCSDRGRRGGCGRTISIFFAHIIPRHTFTTPILWAVMLALTCSASIKAAWEGTGIRLSLEGLYHLLHRWRRRLDAWRTALCRLTPSPAGQQADPFKHTVEHFQAAFPGERNALRAFHLRFQASVAG